MPSLGESEDRKGRDESGKAAAEAEVHPFPMQKLRNLRNVIFQRWDCAWGEQTFLWLLHMKGLQTHRTRHRFSQVVPYLTGVAKKNLKNTGVNDAAEHRPQNSAL